MAGPAVASGHLAGVMEGRPGLLYLPPDAMVAHNVARGDLLLVRGPNSPATTSRSALQLWVHKLYWRCRWSCNDSLLGTKVGVAGRVQPPQAVFSPLGFETASSPQQLLGKGAVDFVLVPILSTLERYTSAAPKDPQVRR